MIRNCLLFFVLAFFITACQSKTGQSKLLHEDSLASQIFTINNLTDTAIKTIHGALIEIKKGSFSAEVVKLEVKEAFPLQEMILAGLTTNSNGKPLSSGGMMYINAVDNKVTINKALTISIPTDNYDERMKVYKGNKEDGKINWIDPQPLKDSTSPYLNAGKLLFQQNCASCHSYDKILTGPAMKGLESRGPWKNREQLIAFTRNAGAYIPKTCYTKNLQRSYGQIMPSFPQFEQRSLNAVYDYIRNEDIKSGIDLINNYNNSTCDDSCWRYDSISLVVSDRIDAMERKRKDLIYANEGRINFTAIVADNNGRTVNRNNQPEYGTIEKVTPENFKAIYYRFDITSFGWYNIDRLLNLDNSDESSLFVQIDDSLTNEFDVFIAVPQFKVFDRGGKLQDGRHYGFYTKDGKIPLPVGTRVSVFVLGEASGQIVYDYREFVSSATNEIQLHPLLITKELFNEAIQKIGMQDVVIKAGDSKNAEAIRKTDDQIRKDKDILESYKPRYCDCNCGVADSISTEAISIK